MATVLKRFRPYARSWLAALLLVILGYATLGLPGAVMFELVVGILEAAFGVSRAKVPPDAAWPIALYITLLWPLSLPLAAMLSAPRRTRAGRFWMYALVVVLCCTALSLYFYALAV